MDDWNTSVHALNPKVYNGVSEVKIYHINSWNASHLSFFVELYDDIRPSTGIFIIGAIGSGKSHMCRYIMEGLSRGYDEKKVDEYLSKFYSTHNPTLESDVMVAMEPVSKFKPALKDYYKKGDTVEKTTEIIGKICFEHWTSQHKSSDDICSIVERLPSPYRSWIFRRDFNQSYTDLRREQDTFLRQSTKEEQRKLYETYRHESILTRTIKENPVFKKFKRVVILAITPTDEQLLKNVRSRARDDEEVLNLGYLKLLNADTRRAIWEVRRDINSLKTFEQWKLYDLVTQFPY